MGIYIEYFLKTEMKRDIPPIVNDVMGALFAGPKERVRKQNAIQLAVDSKTRDHALNHQFFSGDPYDWSLVSGFVQSYRSISVLRKSYGSGKDRPLEVVALAQVPARYEREVDLFFDWLTPFVTPLGYGEFIGYVMHEDYVSPHKLYLWKNTKLEIKYTNAEKYR